MGKVIPLDPARAAKMVRATRPEPPSTMAFSNDFAPAPGLGAWAFDMFIAETGPLHNPRHAHLADASIGWLWTTAEQKIKGKPSAGACELVAPMQARWPSARTHWLFQHWFGRTPDFIITIDAGFANEADDWTFCALIEHELCHAGQAVDPFGEPRFDREGAPIFTIVGHDVEQFHDVVERYGAAAAGVEHMARLANAGPIFGQANITAACGTCGRKTA